MLTWERRRSVFIQMIELLSDKQSERAISESRITKLNTESFFQVAAARHLHSVGHPVLDASGNLVQFGWQLHRHYGAQAGEEALRQAQADLARISPHHDDGRATASLAHEVNQPNCRRRHRRTVPVCAGSNRDHPDLERGSRGRSRVVKDATRAAEIISRTRPTFQKG